MPPAPRAGPGCCHLAQPPHPPTHHPITDRIRPLGITRLADGATYVGPPSVGWESDRIEWVPLGDVRRLIDKRDIVSGTTVVALLDALSDALHG